MFAIHIRDSIRPTRAEAMYKYESSDFGWAVCSASAAGKSIETVDHLRTRSAAELAARELSAGRAHVERHRPVGCRVQPGPAF